MHAICEFTWANTMIARVPSPTISKHKYANEQMMGKSCIEIVGNLCMHRATQS